MNELKPCPFCGGEVVKSEMMIAPIALYDCKNPKCDARVSFKSPNDYQPKDTQKHWNTRPDNWISVEERLPYDSTRVLCHISFSLGITGLQDVGYYYQGNWLFGNHIGEVTHWQPLPEPPKKEVE